MNGILAYSENPGLGGELSSAASVLGRETGSASFLVELDAVRVQKADGPVLLVQSDALLTGESELVAGALLETSKRKDCAIILIGATRVGRQVAAKLAVRLGCGVLCDVRSLRMDGGTLEGSRVVFAGKFTSKVGAPVPCVALVSPGAYQSGGSGPVVPIETIRLQTVASKVRHVESRPKPKGTVDLKSAKRIVAAGRGFRQKEDLVLAEQLAKMIGGAVGASRPLSSDLGWLGEEHHIGLTGLYVHPELYIAVGISGQLQHVAGMKDSKVIVAINKDKQAPIFQVADYGIVGDLYLVLPALLRVVGAEKA